MSKGGHWSKYGGSKTANESIIVNEPWYCQRCGQKQEAGIVFLSERYANEYIRLCEACLQTKTK